MRTPMPALLLVSVHLCRVVHFSADVTVNLFFFFLLFFLPLQRNCNPVKVVMGSERD